MDNIILSIWLFAFNVESKYSKLYFGKIICSIFTIQLNFLWYNGIACMKTQRNFKYLYVAIPSASFKTTDFVIIYILGLYYIDLKDFKNISYV